MSKGALIIGGTVAGIQAALDLADSGIRVHLVESSPFLGDNGKATIPRHLLNARLLEVSKHTNITVWTSTSSAGPLEKRDAFTWSFGSIPGTWT